jgi:hypothetical protein
MVLIPFESVDCSACGGAGWWELHSLLYDPDRQRACFGIFYMAPGATDRVDLTYSITLPDLSDPARFTPFDAEWSTP